MTLLPKPIPQPKTRKRLKAGPRTNEWSRVLVRLKRKFAAWGITRCEFGFRGCLRTDGLGFAHAVKRRFLSSTARPGSAEHVETVALCCNLCHDQLDVGMSHQAMRASVLSVIYLRIRRLSNDEDVD